MPKILVVEDDQLTRQAYEVELKLKGYDVSVAAGGQDGLIQARQFKPDLILLDLMMPDLNGVEFIKRSQKSGAAQSKVVVMTNAAYPSLKKEITNLGVTDYFLKSDFTPAQMVEKVSKILGHDQEG